MLMLRDWARHNQSILWASGAYLNSNDFSSFNKHLGYPSVYMVKTIQCYFTFV